MQISKNRFIKPVRKEIMKPPLYLIHNIAFPLKSAPGPKIHTPSTITKPLINDSSLIPSKSIGIAKYIATSTVIHITPSLETIHPV